MDHGISVDEPACGRTQEAVVVRSSVYGDQETCRQSLACAIRFRS